MMYLKQAWFTQIQMDTITILEKYFSSQLSFLDKVTEQSRKVYLKAANEFLIFAGNFLNQANDVDLRLKEKVMIVLITMCEIFEQLPAFSTEWYSLACNEASSENADFFQAYFKCMQPDDLQMKSLLELTQGDRKLADDLQEDFLHLGVAILAAFTFVPLNVGERIQVQKSRVSKHVAAKLLHPSNLNFTHNWLVFLRHPSSSINVLKALYSLCLVSPNMCSFVAKSETHFNALAEIFTEKVRL